MIFNSRLRLCCVMPRRLPSFPTSTRPRTLLRVAPPHVATYPQLRNGRYFADFKRDKRLHPEVYHCVIQRDGSPDILSWSQHPSLEKAVTQAERELAGFAEKETA